MVHYLGDEHYHSYSLALKNKQFAEKFNQSEIDTLKSVIPPILIIASLKYGIFLIVSLF